jgi:hypothetical protein
MDKLKQPKFAMKEPVPQMATVSTVTKWIPLLCAGAAAGVSIIALNEIKNLRKEMVTIKKESSVVPNEDLSKRMKSMEEQFKTLSDFIKSNQKKAKDSEFVRNVVKEQVEAPIKIINDEEYEEVEVTDDEAEEN